jgi:hypothetical protein
VSASDKSAWVITYRLSSVLTGHFDDIVRLLMVVGAS